MDVVLKTPYDGEACYPSERASGEVQVFVASHASYHCSQGHTNYDVVYESRILHTTMRFANGLSSLKTVECLDVQNS